jgi:hypothetical protein
MPRPPHNSFVLIIQHLETGSKARGRDYAPETFRWHAECGVASLGGRAHETYDSSNRLGHRTSTRRRRMRPAHDARGDDNNATVIDWSTGRYDVTRTAR